MQIYEHYYKYLKYLKKDYIRMNVFIIVTEIFIFMIVKKSQGLIKKKCDK